MAACGNYGANAADCEDCVQVVRTTKRVQVPCTRNTYRSYTVKVPRTVTENVPRQVEYTVMESRSKQVPYTVNRTETRYRDDVQTYQVPVQKSKTRMVNVTRKVPKTIYVDVVTQVPQQYNVTVMEDRQKQVRIPYTVNVPETKYRTEQFQVPMKKTKTVMDTRQKTVYDTQVRTKCVPETKMVSKEIPVYNVVARPSQPCPPGTDCSQNQGGAAAWSGGDASAATGLKAEYNALDTNNDGNIDFQEYSAARQGPATATGANYGTSMGHSVNDGQAAHAAPATGY